MEIAEVTPSPEPTTIGRLVDWAVRRLPASSSPRLDAQLLLAFVTDSTRSTIIAFPERQVAPESAREFRVLVDRRSTGVPLAHTTGTKEFFSLDLAVTEDTLVPRPETELLVERVLDRVPVESNSRILELGTGSGAIALAIKSQRPNVDVVATDISDAALEVAVRNGERLSLSVRWLKSDWFSAMDERFDFVVSNPPYVETVDPSLTDGDLRHEPRLALAAGIDGLDCIREIVGHATDYLSPGGGIYLEHGCDQAESVARLLKSAGFTSVETHSDLAGLDRVTLGIRP